MTDIKSVFSRRRFLKATGAAGLTAGLTALEPLHRAQADTSGKATEQNVVPKRPFGKTGVDVSILSLGGVLTISDQLLFRQAIKMGVTYWDTADSYGWGKNEKAIGKYFAKFPADRERVFLVTKAATTDPEELTEKLDQSLQRMNTSYIDMYFIHYVGHAEDELSENVKAWAEKAKAQGKIRLFGFSAHKNMEDNLLAASKLGWIDGIMMSYNYRLMVKDEMKRAVDACVEAGIGLTAMKTQAAFSSNLYSTIGKETDEALQLTDHFMNKGYTAEQAKLKAVWENQHIASICSAMPNMTILQANVAAALNKQSLSMGDKRRLQLYSQRTAAGYCSGCANTCESAVDHQLPISDIMRCSMYLHSYGERDLASRLFAELPADVKAKLLRADYREAEKRCPQNIEIGKIVKKTVIELA